MSEIELEVIPGAGEDMIRDVVMLLLKKEVITCEELNACQKQSSSFNGCLSKSVEGYMHAKLLTDDEAKARRSRRPDDFTKTMTVGYNG